jgi:hypothetical protein
MCGVSGTSPGTPFFMPVSRKKRSENVKNYQDGRKKIAKMVVAVYIIRLSIYTHTTFFLSYLRSFFP